MENNLNCDDAFIDEVLASVDKLVAEQQPLSMVAESENVANSVDDFANLDNPNDLTLAEAAKFWLRRGYKPLRLGNPGSKWEKVPPYDKWQDKWLQSEEEIDEAFSRNPDSNLGLLAGDTIIFIDVDCAGGKDGESDLEEAQIAWGELPPASWQGLTAHNGRHLPFKIAPEVARTLKSRAGLELNGRKLAIDVRAGNAFIVTAPSRLGDGGEYYVDGIVCRPEELPEFPSGWVAAVPKKDVTIPGRTITPTSESVATANPTPTTPLEEEEPPESPDADAAAREWMVKPENRRLMKLEESQAVAKKAVFYAFRNAFQRPAVSGDFGHGDMIRVASYLFFKLGVHPELAEALLRVYNSYCQPPFSEAELQHKIADAKKGNGAGCERGFFRNHAIKNGVVFDLNKFGGIAVDPAAITRVLLAMPELEPLKTNEMSGCLEVDGEIRLEIEGNMVTFRGPYDDQLRSAIVYLLNRDYAINPSDKDLDHALRSFFKVRRFNPFLDYISTLAWDKIPRNETALMWLFDSADNPVSRWALKLTFRQIFFRQLCPERPCHADFIHIIPGDQGGGKTTFCQRVFAPRGNQWCVTMSVDELCDPTKLIYKGSFVLALLDEWIMSRATMEALKSFTSQDFLVTRKVYGHEGTVYHRGFAISGTTNEKAFLQDKTGNRRFLITPTQVLRNGSRVHQLLTPEIVDQLWAEAYEDFKAHHDEPDFLRIPPEVELVAADVAEDARQPDAWEAPIAAYVDNVWDDTLTVKSYDKTTKIVTCTPIYHQNAVTAADIYKFALASGSQTLSPAQCDKSKAATIGAIMDRLPGWKRGKVYYHGVRTSGFKRVSVPEFQIPLDELRDNDKRSFYEDAELPETVSYDVHKLL